MSYSRTQHRTPFEIPTLDLAIKESFTLPTEITVRPSVGNAKDILKSNVNVFDWLAGLIFYRARSGTGDLDRALLHWQEYRIPV